MDVTLRIEPLSHDLERTREPVLIVGHQGIHRILYAYFMGLSREEAPFVRIPLNHVIILRPHAVSIKTTLSNHHFDYSWIELKDWLTIFPICY